MEALLAQKPDIVLLPHRPPDFQALTCLGNLRLLHPSQALITVDACGPDFLCDALDLGLGGLLTTTATPEQLYCAIRSLLAGGQFIQPELLRQAFSARGTAPNPITLLSSREVAVLRAAMQGRSNREMAAAMNLSISTVKSHLRSAYQKLGVTDRAAACAKALEWNLLDS
ncbi:MAG: response regulator transcription factor [Candidatus Eremiobacteraeota bacterium]|nr:response regulator transcription factor [Candidatus Eremiobacteraeota bacterium]